MTKIEHQVGHEDFKAIEAGPIHTGKRTFGVWWWLQQTTDSAVEIAFCNNCLKAIKEESESFNKDAFIYLEARAKKARERAKMAVADGNREKAKVLLE